MSEKQDLQKTQECDDLLQGQRHQTVYPQPGCQPPPPPPPYMYGHTIQTTAGLPVAIQPNNERSPPDYLGLAIFATVCCFWPTGIFAILRASDARVSAARNDMTSAWDQSNTAKKMSVVSIAVGVTLMLLIVLFLFVEYLVLIPLLFEFGESTTTPTAGYNMDPTAYMPVTG